MLDEFQTAAPIWFDYPAEGHATTSEQLDVRPYNASHGSPDVSSAHGRRPRCGDRATWLGGTKCSRASLNTGQDRAHAGSGNWLSREWSAEWCSGDHAPRVPDDAHAYDGVAPIVAQAGHRALSVYLRGYGANPILDANAPKTAQQAAIGQDILDFADALNLTQFVVVGFDWGCRAAGIAAALHPDRVKAAVLIGGYTIQNTVTPRTGIPNPQAVQRSW